MIPDDSAFCDQCGKELRWCPECGRPKRGTECPVCGNDLVPGRKWLGREPSAPEAEPSAPEPSSPEPSAPAGPGDFFLVGNGWRLQLREGPFGRNGGIWPELGSCPYVSGSHGRIAKSGGDWTVTDCGSTNGTFVNGSRIQTATLKKGDRVRLATLDFTVE